jgi:hypothetical protein
MSAIEKGGAIHVYQNGEAVDEIPFKYAGTQPNQEQVIETIGKYFENKHIGS